MMTLFKHPLLVTILALTAIYTDAQKPVTKFYNREWKECDVSEARFYSMIKKTDSGWLRNDYYISTNGLQMTGLYKDSLCKIKNGEFMYFFVNDRLESIGRYAENKKKGIHLSYHYNGMIADSGNYDKNKLTGISLSWHPNGYLSDSVFIKDDSIKWKLNGSTMAIYLNMVIISVKRKMANGTIFTKMGDKLQLK